MTSSTIVGLADLWQLKSWKHMVESYISSYTFISQLA